MNCRGLKPQRSLLRGFKSILFANSSGAASRIPGHLPSPGFFIHRQELQLEQLTRSRSSIPLGLQECWLLRPLPKHFAFPYIFSKALF